MSVRVGDQDVEQWRYRAPQACARSHVPLRRDSAHRRKSAPPVALKLPKRASQIAVSGIAGDEPNGALRHLDSELEQGLDLGGDVETPTDTGKQAWHE